MVLGKTPYLKRSVELNRYTMVKDRSQQSNLFILGGTTESRYAIMKKEIDEILDKEQGIVYVVTDTEGFHTRWEMYKTNANFHILTINKELDLDNHEFQTLFYDNNRTTPIWLYIEDIDYYLTHKDGVELEKILSLGRRYYITATICADRLVGSQEKVIGKCKDPVLTDMEIILANCGFLIILSRGGIRSKKLELMWENVAFFDSRLSRSCVKFINDKKYYPVAGVFIDIFNQLALPLNKKYCYKKFIIQDNLQSKK